MLIDILKCNKSGTFEFCNKCKHSIPHEENSLCDCPTCESIECECELTKERIEEEI